MESLPESSKPTETGVRTDRKPKPRAGLTRERVLRAAIALADVGGIDSLTMRRIGEELRVEAMSLYKHVANKEDILDGIVDIAFGEIDLPLDGTDWKTAMRRRAVSARNVLLRHRWAIGLMESRVTPGPATLRHHDSVLGSLRLAGFSVRKAAHAYSLMDSYIYGFALQQTTLTYDVGEAAGAGQALLDQFRAEQYPHLAEIMVDHAMKPGYDYADEFEFGLDLILDGLEGLRDAA